MTYLLDTNIVSELRKRAPDPNVLAWYEGARPAEIFLSVLSIGEIRLGIERLRGKDAAQAARLEQWLHGLHGLRRPHHRRGQRNCRGMGPHQRPRPAPRHRRPARSVSQGPWMDPRHPQYLRCGWQRRETAQPIRTAARRLGSRGISRQQAAGRARPADGQLTVVAAASWPLQRFPPFNRHGRRPW